MLRNFAPEYPPPRPPKIGTSHGGLRNVCPEYSPSKKMELLMDNFLSWTGVWRLLLYPPRITSCLVMSVVQPFSQPWHLFAHMDGIYGRWRIQFVFIALLFVSATLECDKGNGKKLLDDFLMDM